MRHKNLSKTERCGRLKQVFLPAWFMLCAVILIPLNTEAQTYLAREGYVEFLSEAPQENVMGKSNYLNGRLAIEKNQVDFYVDLTTLKTGIKYRDEHLQENYLETHKFPFAEFFGKFETLPDPSVTEMQQVKVSGKFKVHGVTREITVPGKVTFSEDGNSVHVHAEWPLKLDEYNIPIPKVLNYRLSNDLTLTIDIDLQKNLSQ